MGYVGLRMTADEFFALGETAERLELIDGVISMSPSPSPTHQEIITELLAQIGGAAAKKAGYRVFPDTDVEFAQGIVYRPDIAVYAPGRISGRVSRLTAAPELVIEVLSPGSMALDLVTKRGDYERFGVNEYWAVGSVDARVRAWRREGGRFTDSIVGDSVLECREIAGLRVDLAALRDVVGT
jgi:Uma2 family endonuclease